MAEAIRKYFISMDKKYREEEAVFEYFGGFAKNQKFKSRNSFHDKIRAKYPNARILEVSTKSQDEALGQKLSAFNLYLDGYPIECIFQSSKVFYNKYKNKEIYFKHLLSLEPREARREIKEFMQECGNQVELRKFSYDNKDYPLNPKSLFYDYIYILALMDNRAMSNELVNYDIFTDIEFNHKKSFNTQARACAIYSYMLKSDKLDYYMQSDDSFRQIYSDFVSYNAKDEANLF